MAKLIIEIPTLAQAEEFAHWYEGQGEQDASVWFEANDLKTPMTDMRVGKKWLTVDKEQETVTMICR